MLTIVMPFFFIIDHIFSTIKLWIQLVLSASDYAIEKTFFFSALFFVFILCKILSTVFVFSIWQIKFLFTCVSVVVLTWKKSQLFVLTTFKKKRLIDICLSLLLLNTIYSLTTTNCCSEILFICSQLRLPYRSSVKWKNFQQKYTGTK